MSASAYDAQPPGRRPIPDMKVQLVYVPWSSSQEHPTYRGGVETFVEMLCSVAPELSLKLVIPCAGRADTERMGAHFIPVAASARSELDFALQLRRWTRKHSGRFPRDAVLLANAEHYAWAMLPAKLPIVLIAHGVVSNSLRRRRGRVVAWAFRFLIERPVVRRCARIVGVGPHVTAYYMATYPQWAPGKLVTLTPGVRLTDFESRPKSRVRDKYGLDRNLPILLFVGRLSPEKNVAVFLDACDLLAGTGQQFQAVVIGEGAERDRVLEALRERRWLRWIPTVAHDEVIDFMAESEALVICSDFEGLPTVLLEAVASRLPVVSTDVGLSRRFLTGSAGVIVQPTPASVLAGIRKILDSSWDSASEVDSSLREQIDFSVSARQLASVIRDVASSSR